MEPFSFIIH